MNYKIGQTLYWCCVSVDDDTGKVSLSWEQYVVRTIRKGAAWATWKTSVTWGKRSTKHGDFGWMIPTPDWMTERLGTTWCEHLKTTKLQAVNYELARTKGKWHGYEEEHLGTVIKRLTSLKKRLKGGEK